MDEEYLKRERLGNFLEAKYREYAGRVGRGATQTKWARELHMSPTNLSLYINKIRFPESDNLLRLALALGPEIYEAVGIDNKSVEDPQLRYIVTNWSRLTRDEQAQVLQTIYRLGRRAEEGENPPPLKPA